MVEPPHPIGPGPIGSGPIGSGPIGSGREPTPVDLLVEVLHRAVPDWLERCVIETAERCAGPCSEVLRRTARVMAVEAGAEIVAQVEELVRADVDAQRGTPLTILRSAVRYPTAILVAAEVPPPARDPFAEQHFPDDRYGLSPASWSDVHPELHEVGLMWGAWKAALVLQRRRSDHPGPTMT